MAKKKQLAGKKTKLAKLPLTRILADQARAAESAGQPALTPVATRQPPLLLPEVKAEPAGLLTETYLELIRELTLLAARLSPGPETVPVHPAGRVSNKIPPPLVILQALRQARQSLTDLYSSLS